MVLGAVVGIGALGLILLFNKDIGNFLREFKPLAPVEDAGKAINEAGKSAGKTVGTTIVRPVSIFFKEQQLESQAKSAGFKPRVIMVGGKKQVLTAKQSQELATDQGTFIVGGNQKEVNVGIIGDILPSNPSPEFIKNAEKLLTPEQLRRFQLQQGITPKGGQTSIGMNTIKMAGKNQIDPLAKTTKLFTNFGESFQKTLTGGSLFSDIFK